MRDFKSINDEYRRNLGEDTYQLAVKYLQAVKIVLNPNLPKTTSDIVQFLLDSNIKTSRFFENGGSRKRSLHENLFAWMNPQYEQQVSFGTGKGGLKNFGCSKVTVDFLNRENLIAYEIDGNNHKTSIQKEKDQFKERLLMTKYGILTIRISNQEVEDEALNHFLTWVSLGFDLMNFHIFEELPVQKLLM